MNSDRLSSEPYYLTPEQLARVAELEGRVDPMGVSEHSFDHLLQAIDNLRGYRCAEQRPFLAHVDAVYVEACALARDHDRGAVDPELERLREALRLLVYYADNGWDTRSGHGEALAEARALIPRGLDEEDAR